MRKKGRFKYLLMISLCVYIFIYGFIKINITKPELVIKRSKFEMNIKLKPLDFRIETKDYVFYVNNKIFDSVKEKCIGAYNEIISK
ncbi:hypothetical protein [Clostridium sp.]|uniref:hypothetical protein n=1 Tax=Clostridium sp. TaxID=1506 RepID=UPI001A40F487|nr:hypothetical protein [Clostridium sp.]MBK5236580.1 hypothetical protein [Clostridium sp.]